ncbi:PPBI1 phosphatase, partial [Polypterus senegalus]
MARLVALVVVCIVLPFSRGIPVKPALEEKTQEYWNQKAKRDLDSALKMEPINHQAKNLILFLGDGMGVSTVTAMRILKGELLNTSGEAATLITDTFPYLALSKTYNVDRRIPDSAGTGTAYHCGVKANAKTVGVSGAAEPSKCSTTFGNEVTSVLHRAKEQGKSVGIVTTTRVQHASPAASYAHSVSRDWYSDADLSKDAIDGGCKDIALQLIENTDIDVILGGGRIYMTPQGTPDPEYPSSTSSKGLRKDNKNLISMWQEKHKSKVAKYVWNKMELDAVDLRTTDYLMGNTAYLRLLERLMNWG